MPKKKLYTCARAISSLECLLRIPMFGFTIRDGFLYKHNILLKLYFDGIGLMEDRARKYIQFAQQFIWFDYLPFEPFYISIDPLYSFPR